ncbi:hypothetical protein [Salinispora arenicola]|uniref:hypothetical protein n=1 Tax=Salinispora arenicola TaxID=168697 RepID=UPI0003A00F7D|nr:hypothetical protein [Salinispora arenicola]
MTTVERLLALATAYARAAVHADRQRRAALTVEGLTKQAVALTDAQHADGAADRARATLTCATPSNGPYAPPRTRTYPSAPGITERSRFAPSPTTAPAP